MKETVFKKSKKLVKIYSKNINFTSFFIKKKYSTYIQNLYLICRTLDELADNNLTAKTKSLKRFILILKQLKTKYNEKLDKISLFIKLLKKNTSLNIKIFIEFIDVLIKDIQYPANIKNEKELLYYCYGVAGTIGLLILPIVNIKQSRQNVVNAIHLGIFMQLINIARDVLEDAFKGRRYLPACWVNNTSAQEIIFLSNSPINKNQIKITHAVRKLLMLSQIFYKKGINNLYQLSYTNRVFINIISSIYYKIYINICKSKTNWIYKRIFISLQYKLFLTLKSFFYGQK
ncbi:phytoene/squalene synthase family protein [Candidatus Portiera aleyrodidarum]|uniref:Phytoene synthase n=1 Tax=Candidatus Portiera aleyrodidarum MED (Bemisia tabaci) TaxID=1163752 RepID=A0AAU8SBT9_9GAMM|nr:squalene/phytoene synthase family protein [Candidatus Portiera aleyrodidarum]AFQ24201.1 phytoene/squalene synthetase [Candidatus Portiera aleyrodidarum BT-B-HRs]AFS18958.1 Phytoene synthase [Candidatus Portiera aleyrodidarum BT-QVLC]AFT80613.1 phytoene synthase [Candidatus Portiera aleyrodidarum BT-QVLC]AFT80890.1 phytoene synthase [Candidatus Portiera aleyrodidarum BT-B-HRs]AJF24179.1 phytoene synthase [Candidatus Portiera aleyrodidarum MED (Bemisia tabaci)]